MCFKLVVTIILIVTVLVVKIIVRTAIMITYDSSNPNHNGYDSSNSNYGLGPKP